MKANPDKFQAFAISSKTKKDFFLISWNKMEMILSIRYEIEVKLLGVTFDLSHISNVCKKASQQLNW